MLRRPWVAQPFITSQILVIGMLESVLAGDSTTGRQCVNSNLILPARMELWL